MTPMSWEYPPRPASLHARCKSCLASLFSHVKNDHVKNLNRAVSASRGGHGRMVRIVRSKGELTEENKTDRRRKGKFAEWMLTGKSKSPTRKQEKKTPEVSPAAAARLLEEDISPMSFKSGMSAFLPGISVEEEEDVEAAMMSPKTKKLLMLQVRAFLLLSFLLVSNLNLLYPTETNEGATNCTGKNQ